jgi:hypothetical protein
MLVPAAATEAGASWRTQTEGPYRDAEPASCPTARRCPGVGRRRSGKTPVVPSGEYGLSAARASSQRRRGPAIRSWPAAPGRERDTRIPRHRMCPGRRRARRMPRRRSHEASAAHHTLDRLARPPTPPAARRDAHEKRSTPPPPGRAARPFEPPPTRSTGGRLLDLASPVPKPARGPILRGEGEAKRLRARQHDVRESEHIRRPLQEPVGNRAAARGIPGRCRRGRAQTIEAQPLVGATHAHRSSPSFSRAAQPEPCASNLDLPADLRTRPPNTSVESLGAALVGRQATIRGRDLARSASGRTGLVAPIAPAITDGSPWLTRNRPQSGRTVRMTWSVRPIA